MNLAPGTRIGPYEVISLLGAGGMGEVYRARDAKLQRDVALKILPAVFATDSERVARFEREAQVLASLNHPNIAAIYGFEDGRALVLELVEGPTLADRIAQGPIPIDEALPIARQIADALEAAHEHGVIHRDLKPANIKLRDDGTVKVLDFGLAKLNDPNASNLSNASNGLSLSPTIMSPAATQIGIILGTAAYMSPEQAKGKHVDRRADMWAFGCVLYEMLTAIRPFGGDDVTDTIAYVITRDPDWKALPANTPPALERLIRRCLVKDPKQRLSDAATARLELEEARREPLTPPASPAPPARGGLRWWWAAAIAVAATAIGAVGMGTVLGLRPSPPVQPVRFTLELPPDIRLYSSATQRIAITDDGRRIVYTGESSNNSALYVRDIDSLDSTPIRGVERVGSIFLSPDGQWIGFNDTTTGSFRKVPIGGGPPATITEIPAASGGFGGVSWGSRGVIAFATAAQPGLMRVPDAGGLAEPLTTPPQGTLHRDPWFLPDGTHLLVGISRAGEPTQVGVLSLDDPQPRVLFAGGQPRYSSGHIFFFRENAVWAVAFDPDTLTVSGSPVPVLERVAAAPGPDRALYYVSASGAVIYVPSGGNDAERRLVWIDRDGRETPIDAPVRAYTQARLSPDGALIAVDSGQPEGDVWILDLRRGTFRRLTLDPAQDAVSAWSPDGRQLAFASIRAKVINMYLQAADGSGGAVRLLESPRQQVPVTFTPDGRSLLFVETAESKTLLDILKLDLASGKVEPVLRTEQSETNPAVSADGRWLAHESRQAGRTNVFIRPYPDLSAGTWQVSTDGGSQPLWSRDGRELFYVGTRGAIMGVSVDATKGLALGTPRQVIAPGAFYFGSTNAYRTWDVSPDGRRFLLVKDAGTGRGDTPHAVVVLNWAEELKRRVSAN